MAVIPELETATAGEPTSPRNPMAADYDVEAARKASYETMAQLAYNRYGTSIEGQPGTQQPESVIHQMQDALMKARQKIFDTLKASPEIAEVGDLYPDSRYRGSAAFGAFAPIFFVYRPPDRAPPQQEGGKAQAKRFYFVYNGRFLIVAAFNGSDTEIPALEEIVSETCLLLSKSGYEFRWLSPIPTPQSVDLGSTTNTSSSLATVLNDSGRLGTATRLFVRMPRSVQNSLRWLYGASFQYMMTFYSLKEQSDTQGALLQTIQAQRDTVLDLAHEFNQTRERQLFRRRKLRKLIRAHCLSLTEKIGRADAISDSLARGTNTLDSGLLQEPELRIMLDGEPGWKSFLQNQFDTKPVLDMVTRTSDEIRGRDMGLAIVLVALLAAFAGGIVGDLIGRII